MGAASYFPIMKDGNTIACPELVEGQCRQRPGTRRDPMSRSRAVRIGMKGANIDGFVKSPDAAFKLHPSPAFAGAGLLRRMPQYVERRRMRET